MNSFIAICYDIRGANRLRLVSDELENYGQRVQRSLFECYLDENELKELKGRLSVLIDWEKDHVRFYRMCPKDVEGIIVDGKGTKTINSDFYLI